MSFDEFVRSKSRKKGDLLNERKDFWVQNLDSLYNRIKVYWLRPYQEFKIAEQELEIAEPFLGNYKVRSLMISLGPERVFVKPISSEAIGGYGRVDVIGKSQTFNLLLNNRGEWEYKVRTPFVEMRELDKQSFLEIIRILMD